ncbi:MULTISPECIES: GNAT family N-acetyltransferase [Arthrobacter]|nr:MULTISPECIES: GNAT family N-acetyltransferase [Arthrobacter]
MEITEKFDAGSSYQGWSRRPRGWTPVGVCRPQWGMSIVLKTQRMVLCEFTEAAPTTNSYLRSKPGRPAGEPERGYRLCKTAWGRGLATEGSHALIDRAFLNPAASRVMTETMAARMVAGHVGPEPQV